MTDAIRDNNGVPVSLGTSATDGVAIVPLYINPTTHGVELDDNITGSDLSGHTAGRDKNQVPVMMGTSSVDGVTLVPLYIDPSSKKLLLNSN